MEYVQAHEARSRFGMLLSRVEHGEQIAITRNGREIARLVPIRREQESLQQAIDDLRELRERFRAEGKLMTVQEIIEARDDGRP